MRVEQRMPPEQKSALMLGIAQFVTTPEGAGLLEPTATSILRRSNPNIPEENLLPNFYRDVRSFIDVDLPGFENDQTTPLGSVINRGIALGLVLAGVEGLIAQEGIMTTNPASVLQRLQASEKARVIEDINMHTISASRDVEKVSAKVKKTNPSVMDAITMYAELSAQDPTLQSIASDARISTAIAGQVGFLYAMPPVRDCFYFESNGFTLKSSTLHRQRQIGDVEIPKDTVIASMHFTPIGLNHRDPQRASFVLLSGINAFENLAGFFSYLDETGQGHLKPEYIIGATNQAMAEFTERLGFHVTRADFPRSIVNFSDSSLASAGTWDVVGKTDEVLGKYRELREELDSRGMIERLEERVAKMHFTPRESALMTLPIIPVKSSFLGTSVSHKKIIPALSVGGSLGFSVPRVSKLISQETGFLFGKGGRRLIYRA